MRARALVLFCLALAATAAPAAPATTFRVLLPETTIVERSFDFIVHAIDGTGAIDANYSGTVTFAAPNSAPPELPANYTFTAADAGAHVFSAKFFEYGDGQSIDVIDISNGSISGTGTTNVRFAPGPTQRLVIAAPATANLGQPFQFTVTAAHLDGTPTGEYGGTVAFDNTGISNPAHYTFTSADGGTKTFTATPTAGGEVRLRVHDADYPLVSDERGMVIHCPGFTVTASNDGPRCFGDAPTLTASTTAATNETGVTFHWFGPIGWSADGQVATGLPNFRGTYTVAMTHPNGCVTHATTNVEISSIAPPKVEAVDGPPHACDTVEKTFALVEDASSNGPYTNLEWAVNGSAGTVVAGQGTPIVTIAGNYVQNEVPWMYLSLRATNGDGCSIGQQTVAVVDLYPRPIATIDTPAAVCPGTTQTAKPILAPSRIDTSNSTTYAWSIENGTITARHPAGTIEYILSGDGEAVLTLTATSPYCSYTTTKTVTPTPSATIASASQNICAGKAVQIPVTLTGQPPFTIGWSDGALQTGVTSSFTRTVTPDQTTHYSIVSVGDASCGAGITSGNVEVTVSENAVITRQPANTAVVRGARAKLTVAVEPAATSIQWYRGPRGDTSNPVNGGTSLELTTPPITQTTLFWANIETSCGTVASDAATVSVGSRRRSVRHP